MEDRNWGIRNPSTVLRTQVWGQPQLYAILPRFKENKNLNATTTKHYNNCEAILLYIRHVWSSYNPSFNSPVNAVQQNVSLIPAAGDGADWAAQLLKPAWNHLIHSEATLTICYSQSGMSKTGACGQVSSCGMGIPLMGDVGVRTNCYPS